MLECLPSILLFACYRIVMNPLIFILLLSVGKYLHMHGRGSMTVYSTWHYSEMPSNMHVESHFMQVLGFLRTWNVCHNSLMYVLVMKSSAFVQHSAMKQYLVGQ